MGTIQTIRVLGLAVLLAFGMNVKAAELNPICHTLYNQFTQGNLPYEVAGQLAGSMYEAQCWPILMGLEVATAPPNVLPAITSCETLRPHIMEFGAKYDNDPGWHWVKLYVPEAINVINDKELLAAMAMHRRVALHRGQDPNLKYGALLDSMLPKGVTRVLECEAQVRTAGNGMHLLYLYLDRDSDGEEFYGYLYL